MARCLAVSAGTLGGRAVPDHVAEDAVVDELRPRLRRALEVERLRQAAWIERVVSEREALVEDLLADPAGRVAPLLEQAERTERVVGEVEKELCEGVRLEHRRVGAGLELDCAARPLRLCDRGPRSRGGIELADAPGGLLGVPRGVLHRCQREDARIRHRL